MAPLVVALIWGINVPLMKAGLAVLDPFIFNAARLSFSVLALGVVDAIERRGKPAPKIRLRTILWYGLLSSFVYQLLFLWGINATSASNTALIIASGPLWTAVLSALHGIDRPTRRAAVSLLIAFCGTLLVTLHGKGGGAGEAASLAGNLAVLGAMITWAWCTVLSRPILETFPATRLAYLATLVSLPCHWIVAAPRLADATSERWGFAMFAVIYSGVLSTGIAYALWNQSVRALGPARTAMYSYLVPVIAIAAAWTFLSDAPAPTQLLGGALVIGGLACRRLPKRQPAREQTTS